MLTRILGAILLFGGAGAAAAPIITVGAGCQYTNLQAAIDNVGTTGTFEFHVRASYVGAPISYSNKSIWIFGGYADCNDAEPIPFTGQNFDALSTIDGSRSPGHPGIQVSGPSRLALRNFQIRNATNPNGNGGGISYNGSGARAYLALQSVNINHNSAQRGGGVFFRSTVTGAERAMSIGDYTWIEFNTGTISGGGMRLEGNVQLTANGAPASISNNTANPNSSDGAGGGLQLRDDTVANIGSPGWAGFAFVDSNHARAGGGVSVESNAVLNLYSTRPGELARIENNDASAEGGGVYIDQSDGTPTVCMAGGGINRNLAGTAVAIGTRFVPDTTSDSANLYIDASDRICNGNGLPGFAACATGQPCNTMDSNRGRNGGGIVIDMGVHRLQMALRHVAIRGNVARIALGMEVETGAASLEDSVIAGNTLTRAIHKVGHVGLQIVGSSIGGNHLADDEPSILLNDANAMANPMALVNTIVWQPGHSTFRGPTNAFSLRNVIAADAASLDPGSFSQFYNVFAADPRFVNANAGDLHLLGGSAAIDAAATGTSTDLDSLARGIDVPQPPTSPNSGPYDIGAYEVQHVDPQVPVTFPPDETFDELGPINALPSNWQIIPGSGPSAWSLVSTAADSGSLSAYVPDSPTAADSSLTTPALHVEHDGRLSFRHKVSLESVSSASTTAYDAAVLEIQIGSDPAFRDVIAAGGRFVMGGYGHVVAVGASLLAGRPAWSGTGTAFLPVVVALPAAADGQDVRLRWRVVTDANNGLEGYWLDTIHVDAAGQPDDTIFASGFDGAGS